MAGNSRKFATKVLLERMRRPDSKAAGDVEWRRKGELTQERLYLTLSALQGIMKSVG
jgi:hypothetical protein